MRLDSSDEIDLDERVSLAGHVATYHGTIEGRWHRYAGIATLERGVANLSMVMVCSAVKRTG